MFLSTLGDSGYALEPWLLVPYPDTPSDLESHYNKQHSRARNAIERCNGVLKARFRCILKERVLHYQPSQASKIINACAVLHNWCLKYRVPLPEGCIPEPPEDDDDEEFNNATQTELYRRAAAVRNNVAANL